MWDKSEKFTFPQFDYESSSLKPLDGGLKNFIEKDHETFSLKSCDCNAEFFAEFFF